MVSHSNEWRLLAASVILDLCLKLWIGPDNCFVPFVHLLILVTATWIAFAALAVHAMKWLPLLFVGWSEVLQQFCAVASGQYYVLIRCAGDFLRYVYLAYEICARLLDFTNIPNHPCLCGKLRSDGTRLTLGECCWRQR